MKPFLFFTYILLFSLSCVGTASVGYLHRCLKMDLTRYLTMLFSILLLSMIRLLAYTYLSINSDYASLPQWFEMALGSAIMISIYYCIFRILGKLKNLPFSAAALSTMLIILIQLVRTFLYYSSGQALLQRLYPLFISLISLYLFLVGLLFHRGSDRAWNPAVFRLIGSMGFITMIFAPLSAIVYIALHYMNIDIMLSLDFLFMGIWSFVASSVLLQYLARIGTVPSTSGISNEFISRYGISKREAEVLELILKGLTNKQIGEKLFISFTTARTHVSNIFEKTGVRSRVELVSKIHSE